MSPLLWSSAAETTMGTKGIPEIPSPLGRGQGEGGNGGVEMLFVYCEKSVIHPHPAFGHLLPHREKEMGGGSV